MDFLISLLIQKHFRNILFWILLSISSAVFTTIDGQNPNRERDSLINEVSKYTADTTRFFILILANPGVSFGKPVIQTLLSYYIHWLWNFSPN